MKRWYMKGIRTFSLKKPKRQLQKDREDEKAEGYVPDEGTRKNPRKTTK